MGQLLPDLTLSKIGLNSALGAFLRSTFCSHWRSPKEWDRFHRPACCEGPSRSSQLRLAGIGERLWDLRNPSRLNPFNEGLVKKLLGNFVRWFLLFCCRASVEMVIGKVG